MKFNKEKFKTVLSYIINRCKTNVEKTVICKLLYFSDFNYYEKYETAITNETYIKYERGPYPYHIDEIITEMLEDELKHPWNNNYFQQIPDLSPLNTQELNVINEVIAKLSDMSASEVSEYSKRDMPLMIAKDKEDIDYEYVFYRDPEYTVRKYEN